VNGINGREVANGKEETDGAANGKEETDGAANRKEETDGAANGKEETDGAEVETWWLMCSPAMQAALPPAGVAGAPTSALIVPLTSPRGETASGTGPVGTVMV
jgi:hypothetical protein